MLLSAQGQVFPSRWLRRSHKHDARCTALWALRRSRRRVADALVTDEISIGDYVLSGENQRRRRDRCRCSMCPARWAARLRQCLNPFRKVCWTIRNTRGRLSSGMKVPEVLLSGNHAEIERWRKEAAIAKTKRKRPDC